MPDIIISNEEETEVEEMELDEWRALLESVLANHTATINQQIQELQTRITLLSERVPDSSLLQTLLETNQNQSSQILGSQTTMMELLTLRLLPVPEPVPEPIAEPIPEESVVVPLEVKTEPEKTESETAERPKRLAI